MQATEVATSKRHDMIDFVTDARFNRASPRLDIEGNYIHDSLDYRSSGDSLGQR